MIHIAPAWYAILAVAGGWMVFQYLSTPRRIRSTATTPTPAQTAPATSAATQAAPATPAPAPRPASPSFPWGGPLFALALIAAAIAAVYYWWPTHGLFHSSISTETARMSRTPAAMPARVADSLPPVPAVSCISGAVTSDRPQTEWPKLTMPANGESPHFTVCPGYRPRFTMNDAGYEIHAVHSDGSECVTGITFPACKEDQPIVAEYLRDTTGKEHTEYFAFEKM